MIMDHLHVVKNYAVEKYLLDELTSGERDDFEAHIFDCEECALDLRLTDVFMQQARKELESLPANRPIAATSRGKILEFFRPVWVVPALAAMLMVVAYQNLVVYPSLQQQVASLSRPEILPSLALANGNSRGGDLPSFSAIESHAFLLSVDIPAEDGFSKYLCSLYSPSGALIWRSEVNTEQARDAISIRVLPTRELNGVNLLLVQGIAASGPQKTPVDLVRYRFNLHVQN
jgi:Putative zinc-finger